MNDIHLISHASNVLHVYESMIGKLLGEGASICRTLHEYVYRILEYDPGVLTPFFFLGCLRIFNLYHCSPSLSKSKLVICLRPVSYKFATNLRNPGLGHCH